MNELTPQGVKYEYALAGPDGARFMLFPVRGKHTSVDVKNSKRYLKNEHDVVGRIQVEWEKT